MKNILKLLVVIVFTLLLAACTAAGPIRVESGVTIAPEGPEKTAGLKFLKEADPEDAKIDGQQAAYRGIVLNPAFEDDSFNTDSWMANLLLEDGHMITIDAYDADARELSRTVKAGAYIACSPDATGTVSLDEVVILHTEAIKVP